MLVEPFTKLLIDELLDVAFDVAVELALGLSFELWLRQTDADDGDEAFADVVARDGDFVFLLFQHSGAGGEVVDGARERRTESGKVRTTVHGVDGIGEGEDVFAVGVVVLKGDFHLDIALFAFHVDRGIVERAFAAVQVLDEFSNAAGKTEFGRLFGALVVERDFQTLVEKSVLAKARGERVVAEDGFFENRGIGMKRYLGAGLAGFSRLLELGGGLAFFVGLFQTAPSR